MTVVIWLMLFCVFDYVFYSHVEIITNSDLILYTATLTLTLLVFCLLAMHTLICVTFSLPPGVGGWLRLLLVALPGLFYLPFSS